MYAGIYIDAHTHDRTIAIKRNEIESLGWMWMNLMSVVWNEVNHKEKSKDHILTCIYMGSVKVVPINRFAAQE